MLQGARALIVGRGNKWRRFAPGKPGELDAALELALGPTGKLRAPTLRSGRDFLVGFCAPAWEEYLGASS